MGSGKRLRRAIQKHGIENFIKEILHIFDNEDEMNVKEKELVVVSEETYNLCEGGQGGFSYINTHPNNKCWKQLGGKRSMTVIWANEEYVKQQHIRKSKQMKQMLLSGKIKQKATKAFSGKTHSEYTKKIMSEKQQGNKNSQYGTCWITNGLDNKKIQKTDINMWLEIGYKKGRTIMR